MSLEDEVRSDESWSSDSSLAVPSISSPLVTEFQGLMREWEEGKSSEGAENNVFDRTNVLNKMAEILEKETDAFLSKDPDPFDDRHPSRVEPDALLSDLLKIFFKKDALVQDLFNNCMRDNFFTRHGQTRDSRALNESACRLALDLLPGMESSVLMETSGLLSRLYEWAQEDHEPLMSYATGLLAEACELTEVASDASNREQNNRLVPIVIERLRSWRLEMNTKEGHGKENGVNKPVEKSGDKIAMKRPFERFSNGTTDTFRPAKFVKRRLSADAVSHMSSRVPVTSSSHVLLETSGDLSNSSWAEMDTQILGHFQIHPISIEAKQIFALRFLAPLAEYQEFIPYVHEHKLLDLITGYIDFRGVRVARLGFEALRLLSALFCHKKFILEWVNTGGVAKLLEVPRPSIAATAVAQCLYFIAIDDDSMEKLCTSPNHLLVNLIRFVLWCMECSHETGKQFSVMLFGVASSYRVLLDIMEEQDCLRRLFNVFSALPILSLDPDSVVISEDEEYGQRQMLRQSMIACKRYLEAHLAQQGIKVFQSTRSRSNERPLSFVINSNSRKASRLSESQRGELVQRLLESMPFKAKWTAVDRFIKFNGISTLLQILALSYDWSFPGRAEMARSALDALGVCAVLAETQKHFCRRIDLPDDEKTVGVNIILSAAEGEIIPDSTEVMKSALHILITCLCAPLERPIDVSTRLSSSTSLSLSTSKKRTAESKTNEDIVQKVWKAVRANNGIMTLLELLNTKTPITEADSIRALACEALVGLARSPPAKQVMSKLPIFESGQLQLLVREPVLQDKRAEHVKFQQNAHRLVEMIGGDLSRRLVGSGDLSLEHLHRQSVVAQTRISFSKHQLLQLVQQYLVSENLRESAAVLQREANLRAINLSQIANGNTMTNSTSHFPSASNATNTASTPLTPGHHHNLNGSSIATPNGHPRFSTISPRSHSHSRASILTTPLTARSLSQTLNASSTTTPQFSEPLSSSSLSLRINRQRILSSSQGNNSSNNTPFAFTPNNGSIGGASGGSITPGLQRALQRANDKTQNALDINESKLDETDHPISLVSIVRDYLSSQHSLCQYPMTTCPSFDLLKPHKCPGPKSSLLMSTNFTARFFRRGLMHKGGFDTDDKLKLDRKLVFSRFRSVKAFRHDHEPHNEPNTFSSCLLHPNGQQLLAGTYMGELKLFNIASGDLESTYSCHESSIYNLQSNREGNLLLTSNTWRTPYSALWNFGDFFDERQQFGDQDYVEFSKLNEDKVIGTKNHVATIYDLGSGQVSRTLKPGVSNNYYRNRATFDPSDDLVLNDGVLFDLRMESEVRKLDKLNPNLNGVFHPNGVEIVSNSEVWELRTFQLLRTVPLLNQCQAIFGHSDQIIYGMALEEEVDDDVGVKYDTAFKVFDAKDYSNIAIIETRRGVVGMSPSRGELRLAVVENSMNIHANEESIVRLYEVGRPKVDDDNEHDNEHDDNEANNETDDNDSGSGFISDGDEFDYVFDNSDDDDDSDDEDEDDNEDNDNDDDDDEDNDDDWNPRGDNGGSGNQNNDGDNDSDGSWEDMETEEQIGELVQP